MDFVKKYLELEFEIKYLKNKLIKKYLLRIVLGYQ